MTEAEGASGVFEPDPHPVPAGICTPGEVRSLLRECVTVVRPGEILVIRCGDATPDQLRQIQDAANGMTRYGDWPRVMVVPGDELGVIEDTP